ncbi:MAG: hypothetical protein NTW49_12135 [Bacteroidia bacterium]|nr:hypothetical protein [Bacteroidia bacterium]
MTPKQEERLRTKIVRIRKELAADKKQWGGFYDDSRGIRYLAPELFIKLKDYAGGLRYLQWFNRTFPDDIGYPIFLFEWTIILFKTGKIKDAEKKALKTYFSNTYLFDKFFEKELIKTDKREVSNWAAQSLTNDFHYRHSNPELSEFATWLDALIKSEKFQSITREYLDIEKLLLTEPSGENRSRLVGREHQLLEEI